jgi:predicted adenylyl cyclase CyaB
MVETEVKIKVDDLKAMRAKLLSLGAVVSRERHREDNTLYDFESGSLKAAGQALRLRTAGKTGTLTFKGRRHKARSFKVRDEFETGVRDRGQAVKILKSIGLRPVFTYRKHRTVLRKGRLTVTLDETPVGTFMEIEGERHEITRLARALGFSRADFITANYVDMIRSGGTGDPKG